MMSTEFTIHPVLWDATYVEDSTYLTSQSDDVQDTSCGARLFNMCMDDSHTNSYKQQIKHMEYLVCWERNTM